MCDKHLTYAELIGKMKDMTNEEFIAAAKSPSIQLAMDESERTIVNNVILRLEKLALARKGKQH